jgi:hypothetical protein
MASSNYRELFNLTEAAAEHIKALRFPHLTSLVDSLQSEAAQTTLTGCEIYLFTDSAVAASA